MYLCSTESTGDHEKLYQNMHAISLPDYVHCHPMHNKQGEEDGLLLSTRNK